MENQVSLLEYYIATMVEFGMHDSQAADVALIAHRQFAESAVHNGYCPNFRQPFNAVSEIERKAYWMVFKRCALAYIDKNFPNAWFREMFVDPFDEEIKQ